MPLLSVIIPVYNEKATIEAVVRAVKDVELPGVRKEIIVVDDGSSDGTRELLKKRFAKDRLVRVLLHPENQGKGAALQTGIGASTGDIVLIQDADLEYNPLDYPRLLAPILSGEADVVFGSRFIGGESHRVLYFWHSIGNRALTMLSNMVTDLNLTDMETCYKVFRGDLVRGIELSEKRFGFEPEITAKVAKLGCRVYEVGIGYRGRTYAEGKKITWKDGVRALWCIVKYSA
ncbi:MAG: glycosyltransferase family 2 protein [Deltaproteobacteria bacterium]|nr:glycosyltransferase family 2 protein [Deltaproteobacteria bacterium]